MRHLYGTSVLLAAVLFFLFTATTSGLAPREFAARLGLAISSPAGDNEVRAQYAGFFLTAAALCVAALANGVSRRSAFLFLSVVFGGLFAGRVVSLILNGGFEGYTVTIRALCAIDAAGLLLALSAMAAEKAV
jgi:hypothetical protein